MNLYNLFPEKDDDNDKDSVSGYSKYFKKSEEPKQPQEKRFRGWDEYEQDKDKEFDEDFNGLQMGVDEDKERYKVVYGRFSSIMPSQIGRAHV